MLVASALFLLYTAVIVPVQLCLWTYDDPCEKFPTLYFDVIVDTFFLVTLSAISRPHQYNHKLVSLLAGSRPAPQR
jgi:hypothetical protein